MIEARICDQIRDIPEAEWNGLLGVAEAPFLSWAFLDTLERTRCVGKGTGWTPAHIAFYDKEVLIGAAPTYFKTNSEGEFVFDYAWAEAFHRAGGQYYPKLLVAVPFTPATARRLLLKRSEDEPRLTAALAEAMRKLVSEVGLSSAHLLFPTEKEADLLESEGLLRRAGVQFHWTNNGFSTWEDYLSSFNAKRRHQIRRERREVTEQGITTETLSGGQITPEVVDLMFGFYTSTVEKFYWGRQYLNRAFFEEIVTRLPGKIEIVVARERGKIIAGAWNVRGPTALFGRYWGAREERKFLHFEVCYYHSIEQAIRQGLSRFEPGAGGSHKRPRGFAPTLTWSLHHLTHPGLARAVKDHIAREREAIEARIRSGEED